MLIQENFLKSFEYTAFPVFTNSFTDNPEYWQMCVDYILGRNALSSDRDELAMDLMLASMKKNIFSLLSNIVILKVLTLYYPVPQ